jgi:hypothetical protein
MRQAHHTVWERLETNRMTCLNCHGLAMYLARVLREPREKDVLCGR